MFFSTLATSHQAKCCIFVFI